MPPVARVRLGCPIVTDEPGTRIIALGDSIMNGHGDSAIGVQCQSMAYWLARAADTSVWLLAEGGATSTQVVAHQVPRVEGTAAGIAIFNMGTNDVLSGWDAAALERNATITAEALAEVADQVLIVGPPGCLRDFSATVAERHSVAREALQRVASEAGSLFLELDGLRGPRFTFGDHVHLNTLGNLRAADEAAALLGLPAPSTLPSMKGTPDADLPLGLRWRYRRRAARTPARARSPSALSQAQRLRRDHATPESGGSRMHAIGVADGRGDRCARSRSTTLDASWNHTDSPR